MKKLLVVAGLALLVTNLQAQNINKIITAKKVKKVEKVLASDAMQGRGIYSPGLDKAADYIAKEFEKAGLTVPEGQNNFFQEFALIDAKQTLLKASADAQPLDEKNIVVITTQASVSVNELSGYETKNISDTDQLFQTAYGYLRSNKNLVVWVNMAHKENFYRLNRFKRESFPSSYTVIYILAEKPATTFSVTAENTLTEKKLKNVVGILPGKSKKDEIVIFSAHYDHLGIGKPNEAGDSIYNGANDDAAGTTAVILLARYFAKMKNNERTIIFATFTAEETGGFGSQYFSKQFDPQKVMAMFNIEMIGTESKWGRNSAYITGYEKTDMGSILAKNLEGTGFTFHPDPYPDQQLFYRSDNATLAMLGVPAHTISTSKMDSEPYYHTVDDEIETLDMKNMAEIIKAIALSSRTIVSGADTPSRVDTSLLR